MNCELCGTPVKVVGDTTKHYEPLGMPAMIGELIHQRSIAFDALRDARIEVDEQARLNGMGAERELALRTKLNIAVKALEEIDNGDSFYSTKQCDVAREALLKITDGSEGKTSDE